jgi:hypothetical protein
VHDDLAAVGDVEEHLVGALAGLRLLHGRGHRGLLRLVERVRDLADLVVAVAPQPDGVVDAHVRARAHLLDQLRQTLLGEVEGLRAQADQPLDEPARQAQRDQEHQHDQREHQHPGDDRLDQRGVDLRQREVVGVAALQFEHAHQLVADVARGGAPHVLADRDVDRAAQEHLLHRHQAQPRR